MKKILVIVGLFVISYLITNVFYDFEDYSHISIILGFMGLGLIVFIINGVYQYYTAIKKMIDKNK